MQEMLEKKIFSIVFLVGLFTFSVLSVNRTFPVLANDPKLAVENDATYEEAATKTIGQIETDISENIYGRYALIEAYGEINRVIGKKEINGFDYALDKNDAYEPVNFWSDAKDISFRTFAQQMVLFRDEVEKEGGHFTFLLFPHKMNSAWTKGYDGIPYNDFNEQADNLLHWLDFYGVNYIDFRETMKASGLSYKEMFYKTDHHWTGYAGFLAFKELIGYMNEEYEAGLDPEYFYRDESNYSFEWMDKCFLGSAGRSVGTSYANIELEDFQVMKPLFQTNYEYESYSKGSSNSLYCDDYLVYKNAYNSDMYAYYMNGVEVRDEIINKDNQDAPTVAFIRDSFASPIIIDMAPMFSKITCSWGKYTSDRYVKNDVLGNDYDYVFVAYYPEDLYSEFFKFFETDVEDYKLEYAKEQGYVEEDGDD